MAAAGTAGGRRWSTPRHRYRGRRRAASRCPPATARGRRRRRPRRHPRPRAARGRVCTTHRRHLPVQCSDRRRHPRRAVRARGIGRTHWRSTGTWCTRRAAGARWQQLLPARRLAQYATTRVQPLRRFVVFLALPRARTGRWIALERASTRDRRQARPDRRASDAPVPPCAQATWRSAPCAAATHRNIAPACASL